MTDPQPFPRSDYIVPPNRSAEFARLLFQLTPRVFVTPALIGLNVLVFVAMVISGVSLTSPAIADLIRWGADFGPKTLTGEWWRLLTSTFIHIGIIHLLFNMWALNAAGPLVERMVGNVGFLLMYLTAGLCGSVVSLFWNPMIVSAGASGAIFGIFGCLLGLVGRGKGSIPTEILTQLRSSGLSFLFINLVLGVMVPNINMAAHLGGLAGGFLCGLVLSQKYTTALRAGRPLRNLLVALLGIALVTGGSFGAYHWQIGLVNVEQELERLGEVEASAIGEYNSALEKAGKGELSDKSFADLVERDVLPPWRAARERLAALNRVPPALQQGVDSRLEYMALRQEAWELFAQGIRERDRKKVEEANQKNQNADAMDRQMSKGKQK